VELRPDAKKLLSPLADDQQVLVETIAEVVVAYGRWPIFDHVEIKLDASRLDAWTIVDSLPTIGGPGGRYSAVWTTGRGATNTLGLTLLGFHHSKTISASGAPIERAFFDVLDDLVHRRRNAHSSPFDVTNIEAQGEHVEAVLAKYGLSGGWMTAEINMNLLSHEPPTWYGGMSNDGTAWSTNVARQVLPFESVSSIEDYLERIARQSPPPPAPPPAVPSPFGLVAALDYLDARWHVLTGHSLLNLHSAEATASLAAPANTVEEFHARLSALAEILTSFRVPGRAENRRAAREKNPQLEKLRAYLMEELQPGGQERATEAVDVLQAVIDLRHGGQHTRADTRSRASAAFRRLDIDEPPSDWAAAWQSVQARTISAINAIREEILSLVDRS
jgi:hypothetical protein